MKAVQLKSPGGLDKLKVVDIKDPGQPGKGQIRVRLHASSLNYHDLGVVTGGMKTGDGRIPMADGAGVVEAIGDGVKEFVEGDHVVSTFFPEWLSGEPVTDNFSGVPGDGIDGYAAEVVVRDAKAFTLSPAGYSHAEAATLTTAGVTAWRALYVNGNLKAGETVLVLGTGGVSVFALQLAKAAGAIVIATSSSDEKLARVKALGADHTINYRTHPEWGDMVKEITGGRGVDHVVEVGGAGTLSQSIKACRVGGHIALIGVLTGVNGELPTGLLVIKQQRLEGLIVGSRSHQQDLVRAIEANGIRPIIDHTFSLNEIAEAFRLQQSGQHFGKICLEF